MKRTINEIKAWRNLFVFYIINLISFTTYSIAVRKDNIILGALMLGPYISSLFFLIYNGYSLGWEYKRLQQEEGE